MQPMAPQPAGAPAPLPVPPSMLSAVKWMYAGLALTILATLLLTVVDNELLRNIINNEASYSSSPYDYSSVDSGITAYSAVTCVLGIVIDGGLWLWMIAANKGGKSWARALSTIFFCIASLSFLFFIVLAATTSTMRDTPAGAFGLLIEIALFACELMAIIKLWSKDSSAYYAAVTATRTPVYGMPMAYAPPPGQYPGQYPPAAYPAAPYQAAPYQAAPYQAAPYKAAPYQAGPYEAGPGPYQAAPYQAARPPAPPAPTEPASQPWWQQS
jgi:hypothetical protein